MSFFKKVLSFFRFLFFGRAGDAQPTCDQEPRNLPPHYNGIWPVDDPMLPTRVRNEVRRERINYYREPGEKPVVEKLWMGLAEDSLFAIGDLVEWTSQSNGHRKDKWGRIVAIVPADVNRDEVIRVLPGRVNYDYSRLGNGDARKQESYLVEVGAENKVYLYHPIAKHLKHTYTY